MLKLDVPSVPAFFSSEFILSFVYIFYLSLNSASYYIRFQNGPFLLEERKKTIEIKIYDYVPLLHKFLQNIHWQWNSRVKLPLLTYYRPIFLYVL
jgi:hypothetical protein